MEVLKFPDKMKCYSMGDEAGRRSLNFQTGLNAIRWVMKLVEGVKISRHDGMLFIK